MCVYTAIIAVIMQVLLWHVDSAPALKCHCHGLESWLAEHLDNVLCTLYGEAQHVNVGVVCGRRKCTLDVQIFLIIKIHQSETTKSRTFDTTLRLTNHK